LPATLTTPQCHGRRKSIDHRIDSACQRRRRGGDQPVVRHAVPRASCAGESSIAPQCAVHDARYQQWRTLAALLDQALDLPQAEREGWLAGLATEYAEVKPLLRELLRRHASPDTAHLIGELPAFIPPESVTASSGPALTAGLVVGPYRLVRELGHGGMGAVWLAERNDGLMNRRVAIKLPVLAASRHALAERFAREREILATLTHAHIARLYDAGFAADGHPYLALEYVEGEPRTVHCDRQRLSVRARIQLFLQVLDAVQYAHAHLVIHRDLKPSNILVTAQGGARLVDFGIAKLMDPEESQESALTRWAGRVLTYDYASPEQIRGEALNTASMCTRWAWSSMSCCAGGVPITRSANRAPRSKTRFFRRTCRRRAAACRRIRTRRRRPRVAAQA